MHWLSIFHLLAGHCAAPFRAAANIWTFPENTPAKATRWLAKGRAGTLPIFDLFLLKSTYMPLFSVAPRNAEIASAFGVAA